MILSGRGSLLSLGYINRVLRANVGCGGVGLNIPITESLTRITRIVYINFRHGRIAVPLFPLDQRKWRNQQKGIG